MDNNDFIVKDGNKRVIALYETGENIEIEVYFVERNS